MRWMTLALLVALSGCPARQGVPPVAAAPGPGGELAALPCPVAELPFLSPVPWSADRADERWGTGVTRFSDVQTSTARPIEVCGVQQQLGWLVRLECPDGSHPFPNAGAAHAARLGSFGAGGRCGTVIDGYRVRCGEETRTVYMDLYHCTSGESLFGP